jgi:hypothetical protein
MAPQVRHASGPSAAAPPSRGGCCCFGRPSSIFQVLLDISLCGIVVLVVGSFTILALIGEGVGEGGIAAAAAASRKTERKGFGVEFPDTSVKMGALFSK